MKAMLRRRTPRWYRHLLYSGTSTNIMPFMCLKPVYFLAITNILVVYIWIQRGCYWLHVVFRLPIFHARSVLIFLICGLSEITLKFTYIMVHRTALRINAYWYDGVIQHKIRYPWSKFLTLTCKYRVSMDSII